MENEKKWAVLKYGLSLIEVDLCKSKEEAISQAKRDWNHLSKHDKKETEISAVLVEVVENEDGELETNDEYIYESSWWSKDVGHLEELLFIGLELSEKAEKNYKLRDAEIYYDYMKDEYYLYESGEITKTFSGLQEVNNFFEEDAE